MHVYSCDISTRAGVCELHFNSGKYNTNISFLSKQPNTLGNQEV